MIFPEIVNDISDADKQLKECNDSVLEEVLGKLRSPDWCTPEEDACNTVKYFANIQEFDITDNNTKYSKIMIAYQDHDVEYFTTYINYGSSELICEIGGVLGLTLGASALSMLGFIENICKYFVKTARTKLDRVTTSVNK